MFDSSLCSAHRLLPLQTRTCASTGTMLSIFCSHRAAQVWSRLWTCPGALPPSLNVRTSVHAPCVRAWACVWRRDRCQGGCGGGYVSGSARTQRPTARKSSDRPSILLRSAKANIASEGLGRRRQYETRDHGLRDTAVSRRRLMVREPWREGLGGRGKRAPSQAARRRPSPRLHPARRRNDSGCGTFSGTGTGHSLTHDFQRTVPPTLRRSHLWRGPRPPARPCERPGGGSGRASHRARPGACPAWRAALQRPPQHISIFRTQRVSYKRYIPILFLDIPPTQATAIHT